jgi:hypothetical protein
LATIPPLLSEIVLPRPRLATLPPKRSERMPRR